MTLLTRRPVAVQIGAGFVGIFLLATVAALGVQRITVMRARANEAAALNATSRDARAQAELLSELVDVFRNLSEQAPASGKIVRIHAA